MDSNVNFTDKRAFCKYLFSYALQKLPCLSAALPRSHPPSSPPPRLPLLLKKTFPGPSWLGLDDVGSCPCCNKDLAFQLSASNLQCQLSLMCEREIRGGRAARNIKTMIRIPLKCWESASTIRGGCQITAPALNKRKDFYRRKVQSVNRWAKLAFFQLEIEVDLLFYTTLM